MIPERQIVIEKWKSVKDLKGNAKESAEYRYKTWAIPVTIGGSRIDTAGKTQLGKIVRFKIRFRPDWKLSSSWRLVYLGKRYNITGIERTNEKRFNWLIDGEG
jgi:head-tail adaptor